MPWIYYDNDDFTFYEAFNKFFNECVLNEDTIKREFEKGHTIRYLISTSDNHNEIVCEDGKIYLKSKFLTNKLFKKKLIDYYRPLNIYINGPKEIQKTNGEKLNKWIIELTKI